MYSFFPIRLNKNRIKSHDTGFQVVCQCLQVYLKRVEYCLIWGSVTTSENNNLSILIDMVFSSSSVYVWNTMWLHIYMTNFLDDIDKWLPNDSVKDVNFHIIYASDLLIVVKILWGWADNRKKWWTSVLKILPKDIP